MLPDKIISFCKLSGMGFGTYLGYNKGYFINKYVNKYLHNEYLFIKKDDEILYNMIGGFTGLFFGYNFWMFIIPYSLVELKLIK